MIETLADLVRHSARKFPNNSALVHKSRTVAYEELDDAVELMAQGLVRSGVSRGDRVGILLGKTTETAITIMAVSRAGAVLVPLNSLLKSNQITYILDHCQTSMLVTTSARFQELTDALGTCAGLREVVLVGAAPVDLPAPNFNVSSWNDLAGGANSVILPRTIATDLAAIMYTSGSTGKPKGVVLSHNNLVVGAHSVASYLNNNECDRILAVLPFSFDAGFSQLTTGLSVGATVILHDYLLPSDVVRLVERESVTGITGVPPLWMQLMEQGWQDGAGDSLRYFANTGGKMPLETLKKLRSTFKNADPYLMYGLTEAFRSTFLPPEYADTKPDSIGKAIPNVEILVVNSDGNLCKPGEIGELVHRGPLVSLGYWNDPEKTAARFKPTPNNNPALPITELAVWSGDSVKQDGDGFLYFVGRNDDMIKTSGYRVSPTEIEELAFDSGLVAEVAAIGVPDDRLGQIIVLIAKPAIPNSSPTEDLLQKLKQVAPNYMIPREVYWKDSLPRNANGKLDRKAMSDSLTSKVN